MDAQGWYRDPYLAHEDRYFSAGEPTKLVRDGGIEDYDPPPDGPPKAELVGPERDEIREQHHGARQAEDTAERERDERDRDERNAWRQCPDCLVYTSNADHVCVTYDGPACGTCGEPTALLTFDAPGYGPGRTCRNGHGEHLTRNSIHTAEQNR